LESSKNPIIHGTAYNNLLERAKNMEAQIARLEIRIKTLEDRATRDDLAQSLTQIGKYFRACVCAGSSTYLYHLRLFIAAVHRVKQNLFSAQLVCDQQNCFRISRPL